VNTRIKDWVKRHQVAATIIFNLVMVATTGVFTLIALGPDSLLGEDCLRKRNGSCFESHGVAAFWAILSGALTVLILGRTLWAVKTGRFKKLDEAEDPELPTADSAPLDSLPSNEQ